MIVLDRATDKLQAVLSGAITTNQLVCVVVYFDEVASATQPSRKSRQFTLTNNTTEVDICNAPDANKTRNICKVAIYNKDTVNATVTVMVDDNGTNREERKQTLNTTQGLYYEDGFGWYVS